MLRPAPRSGFTLVEVILVIALVSVVGALSTPAYRAFQANADLHNAADQTKSALERARSLAFSGQEDSIWGVRLTGGNGITLFKGTSYANRDSGFDEVFNLPSTITISTTGFPTSNEIVFAKTTGKPEAAGSITLTQTITNKTVIITVNDAMGGVYIDDPTVLMCTNPYEPSMAQVEVTQSQVPELLSQGALLGECPYDPDFPIDPPFAPEGSPFGLSGFPIDMVVRGNYLYIATEDANTSNGTFILTINVSTPSNPSLVHTTSTATGGPRDMWARGQYLYVVSRNIDQGILYVYSIATPTAPVLVSTTIISTSNASLGLAVTGDSSYLYTVSHDTLKIFSLATPASPSYVGTSTGGSRVRSAVVVGTYLYTVGLDCYTVDVSNKSSPSYLGSSYCSGSANNYVVTDNSYLYIGHNNASPDIYSLASPSAPSPVWQGSTHGISGKGLFIQGDYFYQTNEYGISREIKVYDISVLPSSPSLLTTVTTGHYNQVVYVQEGYIFVGYSSNGPPFGRLQVYSAL